MKLLFFIVLLFINFNFYQAMELVQRGYNLYALVLAVSNIIALIGATFIMKSLKKGY